MNDQDSQFDGLLPPLEAGPPGLHRHVGGGGIFAGGGAGGGADGDSHRRRRPAGRQGGHSGGRRQMPAYRAAPQGKKNLPTLLVVSEIFGVHEYIQDICRRLAHLGYLAVAPELFARQGDPSRHRYSQAAGGNHQQGARRAGAARPGRRIGLGRRAWRRRGPTGHPGVLLGRTPGLALRRAQSQAARGRCLVRAAGRRAQRAEAAPGTERGRGPEGAGAGRLWRQGRRHSVGGR